MEQKVIRHTQKPTLAVFALPNVKVALLIQIYNAQMHSEFTDFTNGRPFPELRTNELVLLLSKLGFSRVTGAPSVQQLFCLRAHMHSRNTMMCSLDWFLSGLLSTKIFVNVHFMADHQNTIMYLLDIQSQQSGWPFALI